MFSHDLSDLRVWNDMNPNSRHSSIGTLVVISQLTREAQSRHRNGNPYGHDQTNNCHIIACRSEYRLGTARRYYQGTRSLAQSTTTKTGRRRMEEGGSSSNCRFRWNNHCVAGWPRRSSLFALGFHWKTAACTFGYCRSQIIRINSSFITIVQRLISSLR